MAICVKCGQEAVACLCDRCRTQTDLEGLCIDLIEYTPGSGNNPIWDRISNGLGSPNNLKNLVFALSDELPTPRKEYLRVLAIAGEYSNVPKDSRKWLYEKYEAISHDPALSGEERNRLHGIALAAYYNDYDYVEAERIASALCESECLPWEACYNLADFYITTRRYDLAEEIVFDAQKRFSDNPFAAQRLQKIADKQAKQRAKAQAGKQEYLPNPKENRDAVRQKYIDFLSSIGVEMTILKSKRHVPKPIPKDQYPKPVETRETDFDTFVAFDLETTGRSHRIDSIIEIGAIRVTGGHVVESAEFVFQEFAKPYDRKLSDEIQQMTGITSEDVKDAREMWEVFTDFMKFAGSDILVGFNCMAFDSKFMVRAGRYANLITTNRYFDVMRYADQFKGELGIVARKASLAELSAKLDIENPQAHRALADAVTTARVYLKLKEMDSGNETSSIDDILSDLDNW